MIIDKESDEYLESHMADVLENLYQIGGQQSVYDYVSKNHRDWFWTLCDPCEDVTPTWALPEYSICAVCFSVKEERES